MTRDKYFFSTLFLKNTNFAALATITISQTYVSLNAVVVYLCPDLHSVPNTFCILYLCLDLQRKLTWPLFWQPLAGLRTRLEVEITIVGNTPHQLFVWRHFHNFYAATLCIPSRSWVKISWESFPFNLKMNCSQSMFFFSFCQRRAICCQQKFWIVGFCRKSPKSVQRQFQLKYVDFFPFSGRERNLKSARCGTRPESLMAASRWDRVAQKDLKCQPRDPW